MSEIYNTGRAHTLMQAGRIDKTGVGYVCNERGWMV